MSGSLDEVLARLRAGFAARGGLGPDRRERAQALLALAEALRTRQDGLVAAVSADFGGRAREETLALEIAPLLEEIRYVRGRLAEWMRPRAVPAARTFFPARARLLPRPLGVVGIVGAWNYPILLSLSPLVSVLAAGNHAMVKPSERAPRTAEAIAELLADVFAEDTVATVLGGVELAEAFVRLPFDHLVFTGSTETGRRVLRAASENLTPVTLELGGKSPALVHPDYPLARAVPRILTGKLYNAGQTCLAPDYVLLADGSIGPFVDAARCWVRRAYPRLVDNPDYTRIAHPEHYRRLVALREDARAKGAVVVELAPEGERHDETNRVFPPTLVHGVAEGMRILEEEIFGPILPLVGYGTLDEAIAFVDKRPRPLALYYFDESDERVEAVLARTMAGGVTVNDVLFHIAQNELPFGGVGPSGMGHYHGRLGFERFSKIQGVFEQSRWSAAQWLRPPYGRRARLLLRALVGRPRSGRRKRRRMAPSAGEGP